MSMGFRFWRRIKILPGVTLNLSKSGPSISLGPRGAKFTIGGSGARATVGLPGTGMFYTTKVGKDLFDKVTGKKGSKDQGADDLDMGYFDRMMTSDDEEALVDGWREIVAGDEIAARVHLRKAGHLADGAFLAGALALKNGDFEEAAEYLTAALKKKQGLGKLFSQHGIDASMGLEVTEEVTAFISPDRRGVLLALAEAYQGLQNPKEAITCLRQLRKLDPEDVAVRLSLAELLMETQPEGKKVWKEVIQLAEDIDNDSAIHTAMLLYKAQALRQLGLLDAASSLLTTARRRKKDRSDELLHALQYERALVYEAQGKEKKSQTEFQKLYAEDPDYEDVAERLGL